MLKRLFPGLTDQPADKDLSDLESPRDVLLQHVFLQISPNYGLTHTVRQLLQLSLLVSVASSLVGLSLKLELGLVQAIRVLFNR